MRNTLNGNVGRTSHFTIAIGIRETTLRDSYSTPESFYMLKLFTVGKGYFNRSWGGKKSQLILNP